MKKKGKSYKAIEPYKLSKPAEQYSDPPKAFKYIKVFFIMLIWIIGCASVVLVVLKYYHIFKEHTY